MKEPLTASITVRLNNTDVQKIKMLQEKWEKEQYKIFSYSDIIRICMRVVYDQQINSSLNISLTNSS